MIGLSVVAISIAGIMTTIIVSARKALVKVGQATGDFAKALYNLGKKTERINSSIVKFNCSISSIRSKRYYLVS